MTVPARQERRQEADKLLEALRVALTEGRPPYAPARLELRRILLTADGETLRRCVHDLARAVTYD